jgi:hypothetical protein
VKPDPDRAARLEARAATEIGSGHELYGLKLEAIAACTQCDSVVFQLQDTSYAIVHLTWSSQTPERPPWPKTARFGGYIAIEAGMDQHHD